MIKIITIFSEGAVREYEKNNELSSEEWLTDNGSIMDEGEFETEVKYNAYIAGVDDVNGWSDYHIIRHRSEEAGTSREENFWLRLGISAQGSREDIERTLNGDIETLRRLFDAGRYGIGGKTYALGPAVEGYSKDHDTESEEGDVEFHL